MSGKSYRISVIVPVYNKEAWLRECVDSILAQTYRNMEIILVDDASTDGSGRICDSYGKLQINMKAGIRGYAGPFIRKTAALRRPVLRG